MMLNQCTKDFQSLIERLQLLRAYEDADEKSVSLSTTCWMFTCHACMCSNWFCVFFFYFL